MAYGGHVGLTEFMAMLHFMDEDKMKDWERRMMAEIKQLRLIQDDVKALQEHLGERASDIIIPDWIQDPQLRAEAV